MWKIFLNLGTLLFALAVITGVLADTNQYSGVDSNFFTSTWKAAGSGDVWAILCFIFSLGFLAWLLYRIYKAFTNKDTSGTIYKGPQR